MENERMHRRNFRDNKVQLLADIKNVIHLKVDPSFE